MHEFVNLLWLSFMTLKLTAIPDLDHFLDSVPFPNLAAEDRTALEASIIMEKLEEIAKTMKEGNLRALTG